MHDGIHERVAQAFEGDPPRVPDILDWSGMAVFIDRKDIVRLPYLLSRVDLRDKQRVLAQARTRLLWRASLALSNSDAARALNGPDAFDTLMEALGKRTAARHVSRRRE